MVSELSILFMVISLFLSLFIPIILLLLLMKGRKGVFGIWIAGALGFIIPQLVIRIPALQYLSLQPEYQQFGKNHPYLLVFFLALTAALFETSGRLLVLKAGLSRRLSYMTGFAAGAGHGGSEAIALVGLTYVNNLVISILINTDRLAMAIPNDPALAETIRQQLTMTAPYLFLFGGLERLFSMTFHIALSILLTLLIMKKHAWIGFLLVALLHFVLDFSVGLMQVQKTSILLTEGVVLIVAIFSVVLAIRLRRHFGRDQMIPIDAGEQAVQEGY